MAIKTYPLNDIDYQAEDAELFHCTRTSGVYASGHFPVSVTGTDNNITIGKGIGWLKNTEFSGKVFASKEETTLNVGVPDASLPRVDAVVVRFDANQNETYFTIKQGSTGSTPMSPEIERGEYIYELHLYHIRRRPGATAITPGDITDLRMDANYCGLMADSVTQVDMSAINAQIREFISDWENQIANVTDGKMIESPEYPGCYYRLNRGVKEWLNPPMMEDVEYPTTKRQDGKRVYTKLLKARSQDPDITLSEIERIISISAVAERDWSGENLMFQLPVNYLPKDDPTIQKMQIYYQGNKIITQAVVAKGLYNLYITVEYTKPGEDVAYTNVTADGDNMIVDTSGDTSAQGDNLNVEMFTTVSAEGGAYIRRLTINGVAYDLAVGQAGSGAPGTAYPGIPGMFYTDLDSGEVYVCVGGDSERGIYIWRTIVPSALSVQSLRIQHKTGVGYATVKASQGAVHLTNLKNNVSTDTVLRGIAPPVDENDAANKKYVDEVAGSGGSSVQSDLSQNDPTQPDYVKNRTHWEESGQTVIEWDGNTEGRVEFNGYYKVSDLTPSISEAVGGKMIFPGEGEYEITTENILDDTAYGFYDIMGGAIVVLTVAEDAPETLETGVYFKADNPIGTSLVCNATTIHKLDEKFIPASIARTSTVKSPLVVRVRYTSNTPSVETDTFQEWGGNGDHTVDQIAEAYNSGRLVAAHIVNSSDEVELIVPMTRCKSSDNFGPASCEFFIYDDKLGRYTTIYGEASSDGGYDSWTIIYSHKYSESSIGDILYVGYNGSAIPAKIGNGLQLVYESQHESLIVKPDPANAGLPTPTTDNNGAFLRVVDGAYALVNLNDVSAPITDLTAAPTAEDYNRLLAALRAAGVLAE